MRKLLEVETGDLLASGLHPGLSGVAPPLWASGENVLFQNGKVRKVQGTVQLATPGARITGMKSAQTTSAKQLYLGYSGSYLRYNTGSGLSVLKSGLSSGGVWQFIPWDNHFIASNGIDGLRYWDGADSLITTPFTYALSIFKFRKQAFAANTSNGVNYIERCDVDAPEDWTPTLLNDAGATVCRGLDGAIISCHPINQGVAVGVYTQGSLSIFSYQGGTLPYGIKEVAVPGIGAVSHYSVIPVGPYHYGVMLGRFWKTDGVGYSYIDDSIRDWIDANVNWSRASEINGWNDRVNSMARWVIPTGVSSYVQLGFNYVKSSWTFLSDGGLIGEEAQVWDDMFLATATELHRADRTGTNLDEAALTSSIYTKPLDCGERQMNKFVDKIDLDITSSGTVQVQFGFVDEPEETMTWGTAQSVASEVWLPRDERREGRYVGIKISSSGVGNSWQLGGFKLHGELTSYAN